MRRGTMRWRTAARGCNTASRGRRPRWKLQAVRTVGGWRWRGWTRSIAGARRRARGVRPGGRLGSRL